MVTVVNWLQQVRCKADALSMSLLEAAAAVALRHNATDPAIACCCVMPSCCSCSRRTMTPLTAHAHNTRKHSGSCLPMQLGMRVLRCSEQTMRGRRLSDDHLSFALRVGAVLMQKIIECWRGPVCAVALSTTRGWCMQDLWASTRVGCQGFASHSKMPSPDVILL